MAQTLAKAHLMNIRRYLHLLTTELPEIERSYIETRLANERAQFDRLQPSGGPPQMIVQNV